MQEYGNYIYLNKGAKKWEDGLPLGNGKIGAMIMGKVKDETITINEETLWFGPERNRLNPDGHKNINEIRRLLLNGEVEKAGFLAKLSMTSTPKYNNPYQPVGELRLSFMNHQNSVTNYKRILDIDNAIATVSYDMDGISYTREHFVSMKYNCLVIRLTTKDKRGFTVSANIGRKPFEEYTGKLDQVTVGNWGINGKGGLHYLSAVRMVAKSFDGKENIAKTMGDFVYVEDAKEVILFLTARTNYIDRISDVKDMVSEDEIHRSIRQSLLKKLDTATKIGYEKIRLEHEKDYHSLYNRFHIRLNDTKVPMIPTNQLLDSVRDKNEEYANYLTVLLVNYARYLMISSSYQCELPSNLQGIWNGSFEPPWQSGYTININTQMNYWFVEKVGLSECHLPLFQLLKRLAVGGQKTANELYGCRGFCAHHNTNGWACTDIEGIFDASPFWMMGGAWLSLHLYEHYLYTGDKKFLEEEALPIMREAIRFFEDYLYEDELGELLTGPTLSPENTYISAKGQKGALCMAPTMDSSILRQLITWYLEGTSILDKEDDNTKVALTHILDKLPPLKIAEDGRILEWYREYEEVEPGHRHISHMFGLHPGNEITEDKIEFFEAAKRSIDYRLSHGGGHTGWSKAWLTCFCARLKDGEALYDNLIELLQRCIQDNMLDLHPPFQIDGNFGIAEAILEGIIQSHGGYIELLPALPSKWKSGYVSGIKLRGAISADISWNEGRLESCALIAYNDCKIWIRFQNMKKEVKLQKNCKVDVATLFTEHNEA